MIIFTRILRIAFIVEILLFVGFFPTLFNANAHIYGGTGGGWDWSPWGFIGPMAGLMFVTGLAIDFSARNIKSPIIRIIVITTFVLALAYIWVKIVQSD